MRKLIQSTRHPEPALKAHPSSGKEDADINASLGREDRKLRMLNVTHPTANTEQL